MQHPGFKRRDVLCAAAASTALFGTIGHAQSVWPTRPELKKRAQVVQAAGAKLD